MRDLARRVRPFYVLARAVKLSYQSGIGEFQLFVVITESVKLYDKIAIGLGCLGLLDIRIYDRTL